MECWLWLFVAGLPWALVTTALIRILGNPFTLIERAHLPTAMGGIEFLGTQDAYNALAIMASMLLAGPLVGWIGYGLWIRAPWARRWACGFAIVATSVSSALVLALA